MQADNDTLACPYPDCITYIDHRGPHEFPWGGSIPWPPEADLDYEN
jgi:hypothetical protein